MRLGYKGADDASEPEGDTPSFDCNGASVHLDDGLLDMKVLILQM